MLISLIVVTISIQIYNIYKYHAVNRKYIQLYSYFHKAGGRWVCESDELF